MSTFQIDRISDEEQIKRTAEWWKQMVAFAEAYSKNIPEEVMRKAEAVICETVCRDEDKSKTNTTDAG